MERVRAAAVGLAIAVVLFGGFVAIRIVGRVLRALVWFAETVALVGFALLLGYLAYRVLWGPTDEPWEH